MFIVSNKNTRTTSSLPFNFKCFLRSSIWNWPTFDFLNNPAACKRLWTLRQWQSYYLKVYKCKFAEYWFAHASPSVHVLKVTWKFSNFLINSYSFMKNMLQFISKKEYLSKWNLNKIIQSLHLTHSIPLVSFYIPWKHQKPDVFWYFQVYRKRPVAWNGLTLPLTFWNFLKKIKKWTWTCH